MPETTAPPETPPAANLTMVVNLQQTTSTSSTDPEPEPSSLQTNNAAETRDAGTQTDQALLLDFFLSMVSPEQAGR